MALLSGLAAVEHALNSVAKAHPAASAVFAPPSFLSNHQMITDREERGRLARVSRSDGSDVEALHSWYEENTADQPTYADDPQWKQWWVAALSGQLTELETVKLTLQDSSDPLAFMALKPIDDWFDNNQLTLYINGLRINPNLMPRHRTQREFSGCGSALITYAVVRSIDRELSGIRVNSSQGVESFYRWLGLAEELASDGVRSSFSLKGDDARQSYLVRRYEAALLALESAPSTP